MPFATASNLKRIHNLYSIFDNSINKLRGGDATNSPAVAHQNYNEFKGTAHLKQYSY